MWEKYPQLKVTVDQLHDTKANAVTQGALISVFPESRQRLYQEWKTLSGNEPSKSIKSGGERNSSCT
ncbi:MULTISPECIES: hypothetical protein [Metabacillus]|uniref:hypothetical protein n=1 Tax=Metabacillus TaxID=2675233 RepID=UPI003B839F6E|nr:hypothetical protein K8L98_02745 [Metabacillus dongyingensis]